MKPKPYDWANLSVQLDPPEENDPDELEIDDHDRYCEKLEREWYGDGKDL